MELRMLQYFLAVAREQNISAAAESLHLSQPTLSTQLKAMEEELGKQLLIRGTKGSRKVILTEEGMILRKRAEEILSLVQKPRRKSPAPTRPSWAPSTSAPERRRSCAISPEPRSACGSSIPISAIRFTAATPSMCWKPWTKG